MLDDVKLGHQRNYHKGRAAFKNANQPDFAD